MYLYWQELGIKVIVNIFLSILICFQIIWKTTRRNKMLHQAQGRTPKILTVLILTENKYGIDSKIFEKYSIKYTKDNNYNLIIGSFSAASDVSGTVEKEFGIA